MVKELGHILETTWNNEAIGSLIIAGTRSMFFLWMGNLQ
jgi:hypothetical protein